MKKLDKLTPEIIDFVGMTNNRRVIGRFVKSQLKQAYLDGKADGLAKAREIYNEK